MPKSVPGCRAAIAPVAHRHVNPADLPPATPKGARPRGLAKDRPDMHAPALVFQWDRQDALRSGDTGAFVGQTPRAAAASLATRGYAVVPLFSSPRAQKFVSVHTTSIPYRLPDYKQPVLQKYRVQRRVPPLTFDGDSVIPVASVYHTRCVRYCRAIMHRLFLDIMREYVRSIDNDRYSDTLPPDGTWMFDVWRRNDDSTHDDDDDGDGDGESRPTHRVRMYVDRVCMSPAPRNIAHAAALFPRSVAQLTGVFAESKDWYADDHASAVALAPNDWWSTEWHEGTSADRLLPRHTLVSPDDRLFAGCLNMNDHDAERITFRLTHPACSSTDVEIPPGHVVIFDSRLAWRGHARAIGSEIGLRIHVAWQLASPSSLPSLPPPPLDASSPVADGDVDVTDRSPHRHARLVGRPTCGHLPVFIDGTFPSFAWARRVANERLDQNMCQIYARWRDVAYADDTPLREVTVGGENDLVRETLAIPDANAMAKRTYGLPDYTSDELRCYTLQAL